jgi:hypothetical protein
MKKFTLVYNYYIDENGFVNLCLKPADETIDDFLASNFTLTSRVDIDAQIADLILEMTPVLFNKFQELDAVPQYVKDEFEL